VKSDLAPAPNALGASERRVTGKFESDTGELNADAGRIGTCD